MENVLVTGACGKIGDYMCSGLLKKGYNVIAMDTKLSEYNKGKSNFNFVSCKEGISNTLKQIFDKYKINVVIHLACTADNDMGPIFTEAQAKISTEYDKSLYHLAVDNKVEQFILVSTSQIYQKVKTREPQSESNSFIKPITNYGKMKLEAEKGICTERQRNKEMLLAIVRVPQVYCLDFYDNLVSKITDPKNGTHFIYRQGDYGFQMCCIHNLVDFILCFMRQAEPKSDFFNVCDNELISASDIISFMKKNHRIGVVLQRSEPKGNPINMIKSKIVSNDEKINYRYLDFDTILCNATLDNKKARKICPFKWNIKNTK